MQKDVFEKITSFLLGASWAFLLFGTFVTFQVFISFGLFVAFLLSIFFIILFLLFILLIDAFSTHREKLVETKKQTKFLEDIHSKLNQ